MKIEDYNIESIKKTYTKVGRDHLDMVATYLMANDFPARKLITFSGKTVSNVERKAFWYDIDDNGLPKIRTTLVPDKPKSSYVADLMDFKFINAVVECARKAVKSYKVSKEAEEWVEKGGKCVYRYGFAYRGAGARAMNVYLKSSGRYGNDVSFQFVLEIDGVATLYRGAAVVAQTSSDVILRNWRFNKMQDGEWVGVAVLCGRRDTERSIKQVLFEKLREKGVCL